MQAAYAAGLPKWDVVNAQTNQSVKDTLTNELNNFVRYHFQDNSVYIDNTVDTKQVPYETAAFSLTGTKSYYRLYTQLTANSLTLYTDQTEPIHVVTDNGLYNIMAREYKFNNGDIQRATLIETSSFAVIHEVDNYLLYNKDQISNLKAVVERASN
jgi:hypothetical protein